MLGPTGLVMGGVAEFAILSRRLDESASPVMMAPAQPSTAVVHVDQRDQLPCLRPWREAQRGVHEMRRQRRPLVIRGFRRPRCGLCLRCEGGVGQAWNASSETPWRPGRR